MVGTILKMGEELREVVIFHAHAPHQSYGRTIYNFSIETTLIGAGGVENYAEFDKQDLEEMLVAKTLKVYNES